MSDRPNSPAPECIHCGFCLETCPTYLLSGREEESPRGRILLAHALADGRLAADALAFAPLDRCLGCFACESACPSGVIYRDILETARDTAREHHHARSRLERWIVGEVLTRPGRLTAAAALYRIADGARLLRRLARMPGLSGAWRARLAMAPIFEDRPRAESARPAPAVGTDAPGITLLRGCAARVLFPGTERAMVRLLETAGYRVHALSEPACCGALAHHAGDAEAASRARRAVIDGLRAAPGWIVPTAAGCGAHLEGLEVSTEDAQARRDAAAISGRVRDLSEALCKAPRPLVFREEPAGPVVYQDPCHLRHGQGIREEPRRLLRAAGAELREIEGADLCCGGAGGYHLAHPEIAAALGLRKRDALLASGATIVVTANPGCSTHLRSQWPGGDAPRLTTLARFLAERLASPGSPGFPDTTPGL